MRLLFLLCLLCICIMNFAQDEILIDGKPCPVNGTARKGSRAYYLNEHKNRYQFPSAGDFDTTITLDRLLHSADPNEFSEEKAAVVTAYVYDVKVGGVETCNCRTQDPAYRDTHIELVLQSDQNGPEQRVIAEITPRLRAIMAGKEDWSTPAIRQKYKGHRVQIAGWLTYDTEHELEAFANDPQNSAGRTNWRGTCWEIHPIISIKIVDDHTSVDNSIPRISRDQQQKHQAEKDKRQLWIGVIAIVILLILAFFLLRRYL